MTISKRDARALAVRYSMFNEIDFLKDKPGQIWLAASDLLEVQQRTGVEMHKTDWLEEIVHVYRIKMDHLKRETA